MDAETGGIIAEMSVAFKSRGISKTQENLSVITAARIMLLRERKDYYSLPYTEDFAQLRGQCQWTYSSQPFWNKAGPVRSVWARTAAVK